MGKHDKHIEASSEEFLQGVIEKLKRENKDLKGQLIFANDTIKKLQEQCSRMSKWASEIEANAKDAIAEKDAHIAQLEDKIVKLVTNYV